MLFGGRKMHTELYIRTLLKGFSVLQARDDSTPYNLFVLITITIAPQEVCLHVLKLS